MNEVRPDLEFEAGEPPFDSDLFRQWRSPRFGRANPEQMNNPVWDWLIRSKLSAYSAAEKFSSDLPAIEDPGWCFDRFGQSSTSLPDGRIVLIGGEHEDYYDPDFNIYNDVVVQQPCGKFDIYGYPADVFPPTDFHTATLFGNRIIIIGCLGYREQRRPGTTQICILDLSSLSVSRVQRCGESPGWIHGHEAAFEEGEDSILVRRGKVDPGGQTSSLLENIDDWRLHLTDWRWERLTNISNKKSGIAP
jgi:hypothetical protein